MNQLGTDLHRGVRPDGSDSAASAIGRWVTASRLRLPLGQVGAELRVVLVLRDVEVDASAREGNGFERFAERSAGDQSGGGAGALAGVEGEGGDVDQADDLAGVGGHVRDDGAAVRVADEHDRPVDGADELGQAGGVAGDRAQRVGVGDDSMAVGDQLLGDVVPARRLGERAVDEDDGALHDRALP